MFKLLNVVMIAVFGLSTQAYAIQNSPFNNEYVHNGDVMVSHSSAYHRKMRKKRLVKEEQKRIMIQRCEENRLRPHRVEYPALDSDFCNQFFSSFKKSL